MGRRVARGGGDAQAEDSTRGGAPGYILFMPIRLIALDLDDTLLHSDLSISAPNREALRLAHGAGANIVLASGRNIYSMGKYARLLGLEGPKDYLIASNGAEIIETASGRLLEEHRMPPELCREVAAALRHRGFPYQVYIKGRILWSDRNEWTEEDSRLTGLPNERILDENALFATGQVKFVIPGDPKRIPALRAELSEDFAGRAEFVISKPYFLEALAAGVNKGRALESLASILGIPLEETMACGDAMNDLEMLCAAGLGCAPINAVPEAKKAADYVSLRTNDEDFVAEAVRRFVLAGGKA